MLPFTLGAVRDRTRESGGSLTSLDYSSAVFEQFSAPHSGDFATARVYRYRDLKPVGDSGVIARFDDGSPALFARGAGRGRIAVWTSSLDEYWTDLPLQPVWLPFVHELASHIARASDPRASFTAGDALDLSRHGELTASFTRADSAADLVLQAPSGRRDRLTAQGSTHVAVLREAGIYELRGASTPVGSGRPIAVNVDLAESDLSRFDPQELIAAVTAPMAVRPGGEAPPPGSPAETERRQTIWWYLMAAALIFLVGETVFSNRLSTRVTT
jgi:acyl-coenzyme A thioesterase PaaI-like protein